MLTRSISPKILIIGFILGLFLTNICYSDELLVIATSKENTDPEENRSDTPKKGDITEIRLDGAEYASGETLMRYIVIKIPGQSVPESYRNPWKLDIDYTINVFDANQDGYRIKVYATQIATTEQDVDYGRLSLSHIENYLEGWNGVVISNTTNEVIFDVGTYGMATSDSFWDKDVTGVNFSEVYTQSTGNHRITADYTAKSWPANIVELKVNERGGNIISHASKTIVFDIQGAGDPAVHNGNLPLMAFKAETKDKVDKTLYERQWTINSSRVDIIIAAGGVTTTTGTTLLTWLVDKLNL